MSIGHCLLQCCCCCCRFWKNVFLAIANAGNFLAFIGVLAAAALPYWSEYRLEATAMDAIDPFLTGKVYYGIIFAIAEVQEADDTSLADAYDNPNVLLNVTRAFTGLMLIFQIVIFVMYYIKPRGIMERCCPRIELVVQTVAVACGIFATLCGVVALVAWFFLADRNEEDLIASATFGGLIDSENVNVVSNDFRFSFFMMIAATALELIATIFVFTTCTLFCAREVPDEEKPLVDEEDPKAIDEADTAPETVEEEDLDDGEEIEEEDDEDDMDDDEEEEEPVDEAEGGEEEEVEEAAAEEAETAEETAAAEEEAAETAEEAETATETVDTPASPPDEELEVTKEGLVSGPTGESLKSTSIKI
mmetsp:Transcript_3844/g.13669  ORF Transcript_3844/g.13669 Transcript_3844/m.13669 type:complete len:362 (-) Transcript_3844:343-1428(-)